MDTTKNLILALIATFFLISCGVSVAKPVEPAEPELAISEVAVVPAESSAQNFRYEVLLESFRLEIWGSPYAVDINNCGGQTIIEQQERRSQRYIAELDIEISNSVAAEFGGDVLVAEATLGAQIGSKLGIRIGSEVEAETAVTLTASPGTKTETILQWRQSWTEGKIAILRPDGNYVAVLPFAVLNNLTLETVDTITYTCVGNNIEQQDQVVTVELATTPVIEDVTVPEIKPAPEAILIGVWTVPGNSSAGSKFEVEQAGLYTFVYKGGAYSTYPVSSIPSGASTWLTAVRVFHNRPTEWDGIAISNSPDINAVDFLYSSSAEDAVNKANGSSFTITLLKGDYLIMVAVDGKPYYSDNPGRIEFDVYFTPMN